LGGTLSKLKVWGEHCQLSGSLRGLCGIYPKKTIEKCN